MSFSAEEKIVPSTKKIPFEWMRNKIILPLKVNDSCVLNVILDTGMPS